MTMPEEPDTTGVELASIAVEGEKPMSDEAQFSQFQKLRGALGAEDAEDAEEPLKPDASSEEGGATDEASTAGRDEAEDVPAASDRNAYEQAAYDRAVKQLKLAKWTDNDIADMTDDQVLRRAAVAEEQSQQYLALQEQLRAADTTETVDDKEAGPAATVGFDLDKVLEPVIEELGQEGADALRPAFQAMMEHYEGRITEAQETVAQVSEGRAVVSAEMSRLTGIFPDLAADPNLRKDVLTSAQMLAESERFGDPIAVFDHAARLHGLALDENDTPKPRVSTHNVTRSQSRASASKPVRTKRTQDQWDRDYLKARTSGVPDAKAKSRLGKRPEE
jgi:hypothetical protein